MGCILVVDDDPQFRAVLRQMLEYEGYAVLEACDGNEGLKHFCATPVDLVITDLIMPDREGLDLVQALRQVTPEVKIIVLSGGSRRLPMDFLPLAEMLGAQYTFAKPVRRRELVDAVRTLLEDSPATP